MATSASPRGKTVTLLFADEGTFGTAPGGNWTQTPVYSWCKGGQIPLEDDKLLGVPRNNDRDRSESAAGLPGFDGGGVVVPLDLAHFGYWLRMGLGAPVTSGANPNYQHVFSSGNEVLPHRSFEPKIASNWFRQDNGVICSGFDFDLGRKPGYDRCTVRLMGQKTQKFAVTQGGVPVAMLARVPLPATLPVVKINGTVAGRVRTLKAVFDNKVTEQDFLGNQYVSGHDLDDDATFTGSFGIRLLDSTYRDLGVTGTPGTPGATFSLELLWTLSAQRSLSWLAPAARLALSGEPISGPGGINVDYEFAAEQSAGAAMCTVTLKSPTATF